MGCEFFMMTLCCPKTVLPDKIGVMTSKCAYIVKMKVRALNAASGNIFLTNIHRVFVSDSAEPSADDEDLSDYFLGVRPVGKTTDSKS